MRLTAIVLAAGASARLGRPKQLVEVDGEPLVRRAARTAIASGCDQTIVVLPVGEFVEALKGLDVKIVENAARDEGIASSIRAGVAAAPEGRVLLMLCDQPEITAAHLRALAEIDALVVATEYAGAAGVPVVFAPQLRGELMALRGDRGAKSVIAAHADECRTVAFEAAAVDVDSEADVAALRSVARH